MRFPIQVCYSLQLIKFSKIYYRIINLLINNNLFSVNFITPCKGLDRECTTKQAKLGWAIVAKGIPEYGIPSSDPFFISSVDSNEAGLNLKFTNITVIGLKNCAVQDLS